MDAQAYSHNEATGFHPGLLSGLALAGANQPPSPGQDDGNLTAFEVAELDLNNTEMVVLSACETGLGKSAAGEGILGLQAQFKSPAPRPSWPACGMSTTKQRVT